jgi:hypothetical protein
MEMIGVPTLTVSPSLTKSSVTVPAYGLGKLNQRLAGLDLDKNVVDLDLIADSNPPGHDVGLDQSLTGIRQPEVCSAIRASRQ